ncbi:hypothetical protein [Thalassobacillus cyri]|uniref:PaaD-like zinc ribbon domain-containing protein n=1 Tax=Thalassobacillus cyri TaxID=571932 RepID=UPI003CCC2B1C
MKYLVSGMFPMSETDKKIACPFCSSDNVQIIAPFGTAQLVRQYYCNACKSCFEYIKWQETTHKE